MQRTAFVRLLQPAYENGLGSLRGAVGHRSSGHCPLPPASLVFTELAGTPTVSLDNRYTHMFTQSGQFLDHDLDHAVPALSTSRFSHGKTSVPPYCLSKRQS